MALKNTHGKWCCKITKKWHWKMALENSSAKLHCKIASENSIRKQRWEKALQYSS
jgi:hypothetical protein